MWDRPPLCEFPLLVSGIKDHGFLFPVSYPRASHPRQNVCHCSSRTTPLLLTGFWTSCIPSFGVFTETVLVRCPFLVVHTLRVHPGSNDSPCHPTLSRSSTLVLRPTRGPFPTSLADYPSAPSRDSSLLYVSLRFKSPYTPCPVLTTGPLRRRCLSHSLRPKSYFGTNDYLSTPDTLSRCYDPKGLRGDRKGRKGG